MYNMISKYANIYINIYTISLGDYKYKMLNSSFLQQNSSTTFTFVCYKVQNKKIAQIWNTRGNIFLPKYDGFFKVENKIYMEKVCLQFELKIFPHLKKCEFFSATKMPFSKRLPDWCSHTPLLSSLSSAQMFWSRNEERNDIG